MTLGQSQTIIKTFDEHGRETTSSNSSPNNSPRPSTVQNETDGPLVLNEANAFKHTAYNFSSRKKWAVLTVVALCQTSMSMYSTFVASAHRS